MEGAAAPAARDGPNLGPGAPGSPSEAVAGATAAPAAAAAAVAAAAAPEPRKPHGVKRHHHKHNLKHRYELQETLGKGTYGKVKRATERFSGRVVAIKSIRKDKIKDEQDMVHIRREIEIMSSLNHPHIISIYEDSQVPHEVSADWIRMKDSPPLLIQHQSVFFAFNHVNELFSCSQQHAFRKTQTVEEGSPPTAVSGGGFICEAQMRSQVQILPVHILNAADPQCCWI